MKKNRILDNLGIKLISIFLALLLWLLVTLDKEYTRRISAHLSLIELPEALVPANLLPGSIETVVKAKGLDLIRMNLTKPELEIPCGELKRGDNEVELLPEFLWAPREIGLELVEFRPRTITISLDQVATRMWPVVTRLDGDPKPGFIQVGEIDLQPDSVEVTGPTAVVSKLDSVWTERIPLENADKPIILTVSIALDEFFPGLIGHPDSVTASINIEPLQKREFDDIPVRVRRGRRATRAEVEPAQLNVTLAGAESMMAQVSPEEIRAVIDVSALQPGTYELPARIIFPPGLSLIAAEPQTFRVTLE
ncbi:YbbR-like domain-containing protein [candidate division KSB1 bacterium]